jgi:glutamate/tyrosine decarboxylase-like PLP-dependent enzyme
MSLKAQGVHAFTRLIEQNVSQARAFGECVARVPNVELMAPVALNIVCFRYAPRGWNDARTDGLNKELLLRIQETGLAVPSGSQIRGRYVIRVACSNHRSRWEDFEALARGVERLGSELAGATG